AGELAVGGGVVEGRIGALGADPDLGSVLGVCRARRKGEKSRRKQRQTPCGTHQCSSLSRFRPGTFHSGARAWNDIPIPGDKIATIKGAESVEFRWRYAAMELAIASVSSRSKAGRKSVTA